MKSFTFLALAILEGAFLCEAATSMLKCNADNCYRVMTNTPAVASSMCSTYLQSTTTTTITPTVTVSFTNTILPTGTPSTTLPARLIPTHLSSQCVLSTATPLELRLSSACSCIGAAPTSIVTVTATALAPAQTITMDPPTPCDLTSEMGPGGTWAVGDTTYNLQCNTFPFSFTWNRGGSKAHFADCITACSSFPGCIGAIWAPNGDLEYGENCGYLVRLNSPLEREPNAHYALLSSYVVVDDPQAYTE